MQKSETGVDPPMGDGERAWKSLLKKRFPFIIIGYNISKLKFRNLLFLIRDETKILQLSKNFKISVKGETPGGIWTLPRPLFKSSFIFFL